MGEASTESIGQRVSLISHPVILRPGRGISRGTMLVLILRPGRRLTGKRQTDPLPSIGFRAAGPRVTPAEVSALGFTWAEGRLFLKMMNTDEITMAVRVVRAGADPGQRAKRFLRSQPCIGGAERKHRPESARVLTARMAIHACPRSSAFIIFQKMRPSSSTPLKTLPVQTRTRQGVGEHRRVALSWSHTPSRTDSTFLASVLRGNPLTRRGLAR